VSAYLYAARGLVLYALLFGLYLVLVIVGFRAWLRDARARTPAVT
jgi:nicotinamide riboside transporter PnuC